jgi:hypothetical protein
VAIGSINFIAFPEIFGDRLGLRRRLDDDDIHAMIPRFAKVSAIPGACKSPHILKKIK